METARQRLENLLRRTALDTAYILSKQAISGRMMLYAYGKKNAELGRVAKEIKLSADGAVYEDFGFDKRVERTLIEYVQVNFEPIVSK